MALRDTSLNRRTIIVRHRWESGGAYRLLVDSLGVEDIYGLFSKTIKQDFSVRKMEEYGNLIFNIPEVKDSAIVELLDGQEKVVLSVPVKNHKAELINILPATYYARLYLDANGNGKYDTGCYIEHRQPETSFYYPGAIKVNRFWKCCCYFHPAPKRCSFFPRLSCCCPTSKNWYHMFSSYFHYCH